MKNHNTGLRQNPQDMLTLALPKDSHPCCDAEFLTPGCTVALQCGFAELREETFSVPDSATEFQQFLSREPGLPRRARPCASDRGTHKRRA
jgi:hypothetical protein